MHPEYRRALSFKSVTDGFAIVLTNRQALFYGLAGTFLFGAMFGFISASQQIFVEIYGLGPYFPVAFAVMASTIAIAQFINSRVVRHFGMRRISHTAILVYLTMAVIWASFALAGPVPFPIFFGLLLVIQFFFGWAASNMNSLSMEPLGQVAGTAASVFGFTQTVGGALIGTYIGQHYNGTLAPNALGYAGMGLAVLICVLIAEKGKLFGVGAQYAHAEPGGH
jgi:MFS transporter, DHA1 family, multidrug resistance protein